nr:MOSC domain-containing protein [Microbacterium hominis]
MSDTGRLLAVCVVRALRPDAGSLGVTAIDKAAVDGAVRLGRYGAYADVQANRKHHGGLDKALYAYAQEDAEFWETQLRAPLPPGWFGENLRVEGLDVNRARIGEQWRNPAGCGGSRQNGGSVRTCASCVRAPSAWGIPSG